MARNNNRIENRPNRDVPEVQEMKRNEWQPERVPLAMQKVQKAYDIPGFVVRIVNDSPGRIAALQKAGWTFVVGSGYDDSDERLQKAGSDDDGLVTFTINKNSPNADAHKAYLMKIPKEWYDSDQKAKMLELEKRSEALDPSKVAEKMQNSGYGQIYGHWHKK